MTRYLIRRLLQAVPTLLGISLICFVLVKAAPGDPVLMMTFDPHISAETREDIRHRLGLDQPLYIQYVRWMERLILHGDLGASLITKRPVSEMVLERVPATLQLTGLSLLLGLLVGVPVGVASAIGQRSLFDNSSRMLAVLGRAIPNFWLGLMLILLLAVQATAWCREGASLAQPFCGWLLPFPSGGMHELSLTNEFDFWDRIHHLFLPVIVLGTGWIAILSRYMRTQTLEVIRQDYVRTAKSKGLGKWGVWGVHAARNALIPLLTVLGPAVTGLIGGAVIVERVFSWPGMGRMAVDAVFARDYPVVLGNLMIAAVLVVIGYLLSDIMVAWADPRVRLR